MASDKEKGGYDVEFVDTEPNDVTCSICLFVLREPMQAENCGHRFCKSCIEDLKSSGSGTIVCPEDRNVIKVFKDNGREREILNMVVKCTNNKNGCTFTNQLRDLEDHLEQCEFQVIPCPVQGCQDEIQRKDLDNHKKEIHENKLCTMGNQLERLLQEVENKSEAIELLIKKMDSQDSKIESLIQKIDSQNVKIQMQSEKIQTQDDKIQSQSEKIESQNLQIQSQNEKIESQANQIITLKESLKMKSCNQVFSGVYIWKIRNFDRKFARAKQQREYDPETRRFFTSNGYKVFAEVFLNGFDSYWNDHLVVYFGLERGPFDDTLKWPMVARFSLTAGNGLYSAEFETNKIPKRQKRNFFKPTEDINTSTYGIPIMPVKNLDGLIENDTLTIEISVVYL